MSLYFFDLIARGQRIADHNGNELPDLKAAILYAELSLCEIAGNCLQSGEKLEVEAVVICDADHRDLTRLTTIEAVKPYLENLGSGLMR